MQNSATTATKGDSLPIALVFAALSLAIAWTVAMNWRPKPFLLLAGALSLVYWIFGQGLGGIFQGGATDVNAAPLFVLFAYVLYTLGRCADRGAWLRSARRDQRRARSKASRFLAKRPARARPARGGDRAASVLRRRLRVGRRDPVHLELHRRVERRSASSGSSG